MGRKPTGRPNGRPTNDSRFQVTRESVLPLYEKYYESIAEDDENPCRPSPEIQRKINKHFQERPFDKLGWGLLKIVTDGELVYFTLNEEQRELLTMLEEDFYACRMVKWIILKARQIGLSTFCEGIVYSFDSTQSNKASCVVADLIDKCDHQFEIFNTFWDNEPDWVRPAKSKDTKPLTFNDKARGVVNTRARFETAERRDKIGRGFSGQVLHCTEVAFWPPDCKAKMVNSLLKTLSKKHPSIVMLESTGNDIGDDFYSRYYKAQQGKLGEFRAKFFPVQAHAAYTKPLAEGVTPEIFFELLSPQDQERMQHFAVSPEFMNWYVDQREQEVLDDNITELLFCREFPMNEEEAFLGANSNFFEPTRCKRDIGRTRKEMRRIVALKDLPESSSFLVPTHEDNFVRYAKCYLETDWERGYRDPKLIDQADLEGRDCLWQVWERPRADHEYVIAADPSTGKLAVKNVKTSRDNAALGVWRKTFDDRERQCYVQVAQLVAMGIGPKELAREAMAMSLLYVPVPNEMRKALIIAEANAHGASFIDTAVEDGANLYRQVSYDKYMTVISEQIGFHTTGGQNAAGSKMVIYANLRQAWNQDLLQINSMQTAIEFGVFAESNGKLAAIPPHHDDTVTEAALFIEGARYEDRAIAPKRIQRIAPVKELWWDPDETFYEPPESMRLKRKSPVTGEVELVGSVGGRDGWGI